MRTERAIDHSELAGAALVALPEPFTTAVASREIGLLASARSVGYPHSPGAELVRRNCMTQENAPPSVHALSRFGKASARAEQKTTYINLGPQWPGSRFA
jgi:hypothetical protein